MRLSQKTRSVYVIYNTETKRTKIGYSTNPNERIKGLQTQSGCILELIYFTHPVYNYIKLEGEMHEMFKEHRYLGEWFNIHFDKPVEQLKAAQKNYTLCKIVKMYRNGLNATAISKQLNASRSGVIKDLTNKGVYKTNIVEAEEPKQRKSRYKKPIPKIIVKRKHNGMLTNENIEEMVRISRKKRDKRNFNT